MTSPGRSGEGHTPGPWTVRPSGDGAYLNIDAWHRELSSDWLGHSQCWFNEARPRDETEANASLIAAAPDFAAVAPDAADILDNYAGFIRHSVKANDLDMHPYLPHLEDVAAQLRAAIAKATGKDTP